MAGRLVVAEDAPGAAMCADCRMGFNVCLLHLYQQGFVYRDNGWERAAGLGPVQWPALLLRLHTSPVASTVVLVVKHRWPWGGVDDGLGWLMD